MFFFYCFDVVPTAHVSAVTKSETGTWDSGTPGRGTRGRRDVGRGRRGRDKQTTPKLCAEFAIYNFRWSRQRYYMMESLPVADDFQPP